MIEVTEVSIAKLRAALESGQTTAVELVQAYLERIAAYDGADTATALNAVVVPNPSALAEAEAADDLVVQTHGGVLCGGACWMARGSRPSSSTMKPARLLY